MSSTRRKFVQDSALGFLALSLGGCATKVPVPGYTPGHKGYAYLGLGVTDEESILRKIDLSTYEYEDLSVPLGRLHAVTKSQTNPEEIFILDFQGSAVKMNAKTKRLIARVDHRTSGEGIFYGHGIHDPEKDILWCTEQSGPQSFVRARSAQDLKLISGKDLQFPGGHHLTRLPGTELIVTAGTDDKGNHFIAFYNIQTNRMERIVPTEYPGVHVLPVSSSEVIAVSTEFTMGDQQLRNFNRYTDPRERRKMSAEELKFAGTSPLLYANLNGEMKTYWDPSRKELFQLGLGLDRLMGKDSYVTSHHTSNTVIVWKDFRVQKVIPVPGPLVVVATLDGREVAVQSEGGLKIYSLDSGALVKDLRFKHPVITLSKY